MSAHAAPPRLHRRTSAWGLIPALLVSAAAPAFFVVRVPWLGWVLLAAGLVGALLVDRRADAAALRRHADDEPPSLLRDLSLIAVGQLIVSAIPLKAELDNLAMLRFTVALGGAVVVPYVVSRWVYRDRAIRFPWRGGGRWARWQLAWLVAVLALGWLILPFYFITSGVYQNWPVVDTPDLIARLFVGVGAVGIWDELFFICTVFALLRRHFPVWQANLLQTIVFVSFLWELSGVGPGADDPVRPRPGVPVPAHAIARLRRLRPPPLRRRRVRRAGPRAQPGARPAVPRVIHTLSGAPGQEIEQHRWANG